MITTDKHHVKAHSASNFSRDLAAPIPPPVLAILLQYTIVVRSRSKWQGFEIGLPFGSHFRSISTRIQGSMRKNAFENGTSPEHARGLRILKTSRGRHSSHGDHRLGQNSFHRRHENNPNLNTDARKNAATRRGSEGPMDFLVSSWYPKVIQPSL